MLQNNLKTRKHALKMEKSWLTIHTEDEDDAFAVTPVLDSITTDYNSMVKEIQGKVKNTQQEIREKVPKES